MVIELFGIAAMAAFISEVSGLMDKLKYQLWLRGYHTPEGHPLRLRPLDCPVCLGYWLGLLYFFIHWQGPYALLLCPFITSILSLFFVKIVKP